MESDRLLYFDYEHLWEIREVVKLHIDVSGFENELVVPPFHPQSLLSSSLL